MKKRNSSDYKEGVIKTMWNQTAQLLQERYFIKYNIKFDPFKDPQFQKSRMARNSKRKLLQDDPKNHWKSASARALTYDEYKKIFDENNPEDLQKKFYQLAAVELDWRVMKSNNLSLNIM